MNSKLFIDDEFKSIIPPLTDEEYLGLEQSILEEGCRDPLVIWNNVIIDGHNRYTICMEAGLVFSTVEKNFDSREQAKIWILENQLGRRNINAAQRIDLTDKLFGLKEQNEAKERQKVHGKTAPGKNKDNTGGNISTSVKSRDCLGVKARVSGKTYEKGIKIKQSNPVLWKECLDGNKSINEAEKELKKIQKTQERERLAEEGKNIQITDEFIDLRYGDFKQKLRDIPDNSIDLVLTDPPYPYEFIESWAELSKFAKRVLKPGCFCVTYSGQMHLPEVIERLGKHLEYYWAFCLYHEGQTQIVNGVNLICRWKPILIYQKKPKKKLEITTQDYINC